MKRKFLQEALKVISKGFPKTQTLPILENLVITSNRMYLFDLTTRRECFIPSYEKVFEGDTKVLLLNLAMVKSIAATKDYSSISFNLNEETGKVDVYGDGSVFCSLENGKFDEYPEEDYNLYPLEVRVNPHMLGIAHDLLFAIEKNAINEKLKCLMLTQGHLCATDAKRLPFHKLSPVDFPDLESFTNPKAKDLRVFIDPTFVRSLPMTVEKPFTFMLSDPKDEKRFLRIVIDDIYVFTTRVPEYDRIDILSVIPRGINFSLVMYEPTITNNLKIAIATNPNTVKVSWDQSDPGYLYFHSRNDDSEEFFTFKSKLIKTPNGIARFRFGYNPTFLLQMIGFEQTKYVEVCFSKVRTPIMLFKHGLLMNVLIDNEECEDIKERKDEQPNSTRDEEKNSAAVPDQPDPDRGSEPEGASINPNYNFEHEGSV